MSRKRTPIYRRSKKHNDPRDIVTKWAIAVVDGDIVSGNVVRHAAERHLRDLTDGPRRGLHWDLDAALHVIGWYPAMLSITAGDRAGEPFNLLPYHVFLTGSLFGWKRVDTGRRRFRTVYTETGKGQAKSPWMAATGLYLMRFGGVARFEGYAIAGTENQSGIVLGEAAAMCRAPVPGEAATFEEKTGLQLRGTGDLTWQIEWDGNEYGLGICKLRNVSSGSSISGPKPSLIMGDEVHEWMDRSLLEMWTAAIQKMPGDPIMLLGTNTPAASQIIGTEQSDYYTAVAKGEFEDDTSLALVCTGDEGDDPLNDERVWAKSLPALGITYPIDNIRDAVKKAAGLPGDELTLKRLFFGIRVGSIDGWINETLWQSVLGELDDSELIGLPCWGGLDLSSRKDLTALAVVWQRPNGHLLARIFYWTPGSTLDQREKEDKAPYRLWADRGHLIAVPGPTIPKAWPAVRTKEIRDQYDLRGLAYDPAQILDFNEAADEAGLPIWTYEGPDEPYGDGLMMVRHGQGWKGLDNPAMLAMPRSVKAAEDVILNGRITIERNPVTNYCSANMALKPGANPDQRVPIRRHPRARIDGMVALFQAISAMENFTVPVRKSVYEQIAEAQANPMHGSEKAFPERTLSGRSVYEAMPMPREISAAQRPWDDPEI